MFWLHAIASHSFIPLALGGGHFEGSLIHKSIEQFYILVVTRILFVCTRAFARMFKMIRVFTRMKLETIVMTLACNNKKTTGKIYNLLGRNPREFILEPISVFR